MAVAGEKQIKGVAQVMQEAEHSQTSHPRATTEIAHRHVFAEEGNFYQSGEFQAAQIISFIQGCTHSLIILRR